MHLPSDDHAWQIPAADALPMPPTVLFFRSTPLDTQDTSYFAASDRILSFSNKLSSIIPLPFFFNDTTAAAFCQTYVRIKNRNLELLFIVLSYRTGIVTLTGTLSISFAVRVLLRITALLFGYSTVINVCMVSPAVVLPSDLKLYIFPSESVYS